MTPASRAPRKILTVSVCVLALVLLVAPAASAGPLDQVTGVLNNVTAVVAPVLEGDTQGSSGGQAPANQDSGLGGAIAGVVSTITESGTVSPITNVVEETVKTVEEISSPVKEALKTLGGTVASASETATAVTAAAEKTVREATGQNVNPDSKKDRQRTPRASRNGTTQTASDTKVLGSTFADALRRDAQAPVIAPSTTTFVAPPAESVITQVGRIATEAAKQVAFPMLLTLLVVGFLFTQNRIDRSDPKLALAPVESDHDLLSFT